MSKRYQFGDHLYHLILQMLKNEVLGYTAGGRLNLGGGEGPDGGAPGTPRPIEGQLPQRFVAYDTTAKDTPELYGTTRSGWENSLVDNLNHMRYWMLPARWFEPKFDGSYTVIVGSGLWWRGVSTYTDFDGDTVTVTSPDSQPRIDVVYISAAGDALIQKGTPAASPSPTYPGVTHLPVCEVYVKDSGFSPGVDGVTYTYQSGVAQGYLLRDVRPYFGVNYDASTSGVQYLYELLDVSSTVQTPSDDEILTYDADLTLWKAVSWDLGGLGGGHPTLQVDGPLTTMSGVGGAYIFTRSGEFDAIYLYAGGLGISGATIVDINLNGTTIFPSQGDRPSLTYDDVNSVVKVTLSGVSYQDEYVLTADVDQIASEVTDLTIVCAVDSPAAEMDLGDVGVVGVLPLSKLYDGLVSGYPLLSQGNGALGGPAYGQMAAVGLQNNAVTYDKLGAGAGKLRYRQGGSATDWSDGGGTTNYDISADDLKIEAGSIEKVIVTGTSHYQAFSVTFPESFSNVPAIVYGLHTTNLTSTAECRINSITSSGFSGRLYITNDNDATITLMWTAIGDE